MVGHPLDTYVRSFCGALTVGSMKTGNRVAGSDSSSWSGTTTSSPASTSSGITAWRAPACTPTPTAALAAKPSPGEESHILGAGTANTVVPAWSTATRFPSAPSCTVTPVTRNPKRIFASAGWLAASGVLTTSTSEKPSGLARTCRSTPGSTSG